jgi:hypothetical protein
VRHFALAPCRIAIRFKPKESGSRTADVLLDRCVFKGGPVPQYLAERVQGLKDERAQSTRPKRARMESFVLADKQTRGSFLRGGRRGRI